MGKANQPVKVFISWSGPHSKKIAEELKNILETQMFAGQIQCFVSSESIVSGEDWYKIIKSELKKSSLGLLCMTKENIKSPWLYFEAGALVRNEIKVIPLLFNCDQQSLEGSPISRNQCVQFYESEKFKKMLREIRTEYNLLPECNQQMVNVLANNVYKQFRERIQPELDELKNKRYFSERYIYPQNINTMTMDTAYISAPMSSLDEAEYASQQKFLKELETILKTRCGFRDVYCPSITTKGGEWDDISTAIEQNYSQLRQVHHLIVIYPDSLPTSSIAEIGYGIALCKNTIIFYKDELPFMLKGAAQDIPHLHTRRYTNYKDILRFFLNDKSLLKVKGERPKS